MLGAARMAADTAQPAEVVNRLPNVPPPLITLIVKLDQRAQNHVVDNRQYQHMLTESRRVLNMGERYFIVARQDTRITMLATKCGLRFGGARQSNDRPCDARHNDGRTSVAAHQTYVSHSDARHNFARPFADNRITQTDTRQFEHRMFADTHNAAVDHRPEASFVDSLQAVVRAARHAARVFDQRTQATRQLSNTSRRICVST